MTTPLSYATTPSGTIDGSSILAGYQQVINRQNYRGIASLRHGTKYIAFRTNPNSVMWSYKLNTAVENTYGGRVIQILSTSMEDLRVVIECGLGGWNYAMQIAEFMRNMLVDQRNGEPGTFEYTTRGYNLKVFAVNVPFQDTVTETTRQIELNFKIQEDVSGVITKQTISAELAKLKDGIGFSHNKFNTGAGTPGDGTIAPIATENISTGNLLNPQDPLAVNPFATNPGNQYGGGSNLLGFITNPISSIGSLFGL